MKPHLQVARPRRLAIFAATSALVLTGCATVSFANYQAIAAPIAAAAEVEEAPPRPPEVGEVAPDFALNDLQGAKVQLSTLAQQGPVVLVMLRGFPGYQCPFCTRQVGELLNHAEEFATAGARVLLVYPGPAEGLQGHADEFVRGKTLPTNFYFVLDPDFTFTNQYGLRWDAPRETSYPSTFVLNTERKVLFAKISHEHGDRATVEDILAVLPH